MKWSRVMNKVTNPASWTKMETFTTRRQPDTEAVHYYVLTS